MEPHVDPLARALLEQREWLRALARRLAGAGDADELEQETWRAALASRRAGVSEARPWLAAIARNLARGLRRTRGRVERRERAAARPEALPSAAELVERLDAERRVAEELAALREPLRATLLLRFHEGLSAEEIAARQGIPAGTVRWRTSQGLDELRARLERAFGGRDGLRAVLLEIAGEREGAAPLAPAEVALGAGLALPLAAAAAAVAALALGLSRVGGAARAEVAPPALARSSTNASTAPADAAADVAGRREPAPIGGGRGTGSPARLRLVESDGAPLAGALTVLVADGKVARELRSDADGRLELEPGPRELAIERAGAFPYRATLELEAGERELVLDDGEVLEGEVRLANGALRRALELVVYLAEREDVRPPSRASGAARLLLDVATARTDRDGRFRVRGLRAGRAYVVQLPAGYARAGTLSVASPDAGARFALSADTRRVALDVERFPAVFGRVVDAHGAPSEALIAGRFTRTAGTSLDVDGRAGADGVFELFAGEPWRALRIEYFGLPGERGRSERSVDADGAGGELDLGDLALAPGRELLVRVRDAAGAPIAGARVSPSGVRCDERGEARLAGCTAEALGVAARGYAAATVDVPDEGDALDVVLERAASLVLDLRARGEDPGELLVEVEAAQPFFAGADPSSPDGGTAGDGRLVTWGGAPFVARFRTATDGRLRTVSLRAGVALVVRIVGCPGTVHEERLAPLALGEWRERTLELALPVTHVRGRVLDEDGAPIAGATVTLPSLRSPSRSSAHFPSVESGADGRFGAHFLACADARLTVSRTGFRRSTLHVPAAGADAVEIVLARGRELVVTVVDALGRPAGGGRLWVGEPGDALEERLASAPGRFDVRNLGDEEVEVQLAIGGLTLARRAAPCGELELVVPTMGAVDARWSATGETAAAAWLAVELRASGAERPLLRHDAHGTPQGAHHFEPVAPGSYEALLLVEDGDGERVLARCELVVVAEETARVDL